MGEPIRDEVDVFVTGRRDMPVKDMKPIDLENAEVRFDYGSRFKEISKLSEDEDLFRPRDFKELSDSFLQFGDLVSELWLAVDHLMQLYLDGDLKLTKDDVFVVWFCKTLQNWKALVSTTVSDGMYYEVTHNGDKNETYLDAYKKWQNVRYPDA